MICRRVMVPRTEVVFFEVDQSLAECLEIVRRTKHTRYPLCEDSLEHVLGIIHIKDLAGVGADSQIDLRTLARPLHHVPETMPTSQLLRHFQKTHQLMAIVVDEYGTVVGVVTLENVLEQIIGPVEGSQAALSRNHGRSAAPSPDQQRRLEWPPTPNQGLSSTVAFVALRDSASLVGSLSAA